MVRTLYQWLLIITNENWLAKLFWLVINSFQKFIRFYSFILFKSFTFLQKHCIYFIIMGLVQRQSKNILASLQFVSSHWRFSMADEFLTQIVVRQIKHWGRFHTIEKTVIPKVLFDIISFIHDANETMTHSTNTEVNLETIDNLSAYFMLSKIHATQQRL